MARQTGSAAFCPGIVVLGLLFLVVAEPGNALPTGAQVAAGQASITGDSTSLTVTQSSERAIFNWQGFDIGSGESVNFLQPSASSVSLNRVTGSVSPSEILGSLTANGTVMLINPNGVVFGRDAQVNVGSLLATTSDITDSRFMSGDYRFDLRIRPVNW